MDEETVKTLVGIDKQVIIDFLMSLHWYMNTESDWWTLTSIGDDGIRLMYQDKDRWGDYNTAQYYLVPWEYVISGQISSFIEEQDEKREQETLLKAQKAAEEKLLREEKQKELEEQKERQLFERLKEKYETAK